MGDSGRDAALAAAAALLAAADGADPGAVRRRLERAGGPVAAFDDHLAHLGRKEEAGEEAAFQALHPVKGDAGAAAALMEAVMAAGGDALTPAQADAARRVCETLNLSPTRYGL
ncbi:MAG TPA: hypothetical protein VEB20_07135 [Azospirillaceae bacterium]|nr:hypothetical protein [Azospirillaceae bacterium]